MAEPGTASSGTRRSFGALVADVPRLIGELLRAEIDALKAELASSARRAGLGLGLVVGAFVILLIAVVVLVWAGVAALALVLPVWAAALIVAGALIVLAGLLGWLGLVRLRTAGPDLSGRAESIGEDIRAIKGELPRTEPRGGADG